ncbi:MAG: hypothetical protein IKC68_05165, partial [Bacteroidales bacterium]|nr:hypothetical protein [Bacteroidales bacterium]
MRGKAAKVRTWGEMCLLAGFLIYNLLIPNAKNKEKESPKGGQLLRMLFAMVFILFLAASKDYYFIGKTPFWWIALLVGIPFGVLATVRHTKNADAASRFFSALLNCLLMVFLVHTLVLHLNYALDFDQPTEYTSVIEDKDYERHHKGGNTYKLKVTADGESLYLRVNSLEYDRYEVGDEYSFRKYGGAFGV